jgi:hypothetical protein
MPLCARAGALKLANNTMTAARNLMIVSLDRAKVSCWMAFSIAEA